MPDQPPAASAIGLIRMRGGKSAQLSLDRLRDQLPSTLTPQIRRWVGRKSTQAGRNPTSVAFVMWHTVRHDLSDRWRDMAHSLRDLRRVNTALICRPIPPSPTFDDSSVFQSEDVFGRFGPGEGLWLCIVLLLISTRE